MKERQYNESGAVLLILVLVASIFLTVGIALVENTVLDTQVAVDESDSKRAEAAAEAGLDAAIESGGDITGSNFSNLFRSGTDITGQAINSTSTSTTFTTPLIAKDQQFTFYASGYNDATDTITGSFSDSFNLTRVQPSSDDCSGQEEMMVELTAISTSSGVVGRYIFDPCSLATTGSSRNTANFGDSITIGSAFHLIFLRVIATDANFTGARLTLTRETGGDWPQQGRTIVSTAETAGGVEKSVELFVSYPQIPADFFIMSM